MIAGWRTLSAAGLAALALASCAGPQVTEPVTDGVVWTRLTPATLDNALYPDFLGDSLVYTSIGVDGRDRITVSGADGADPVVMNYPGPAAWIDFRPRWVRPQLIVYQANRSGSFGIRYRDFETDTDIRLVDTPMNESAPAPRPNAPGLVFVEYDNNSATYGSGDLRGRLVLIPDTAAVPLEFIYLTPDTMRCGEPNWDPTGQRLAFSVESPADSTRNLYTMHLAPGDSLPVRITTGPFHDFSPKWSPDGGRILFSSNRTGRYGVWIVHPAGETSGLQLIAFDDPGGFAFTPAWTPSGTEVVVSSAGRGGTRALWRLSNLPPFAF